MLAFGACGKWSLKESSKECSFLLVYSFRKAVPYAGTIGDEFGSICRTLSYEMVLRKFAPFVNSKVYVSTYLSLW